MINVWWEVVGEVIGEEVCCGSRLVVCYGLLFLCCGGVNCVGCINWFKGKSKKSNLNVVFYRAVLTLHLSYMLNILIV